MKGSGDGSISLSPDEQAYVTSNFDDDGAIVLPRFDTSTFHIKDHPCPGRPAYDLDGSIGSSITTCWPDFPGSTGVTEGLRGVGEERDGGYGFSFDCTDTVKGDSGTTTVTVSGFLAGTYDVPAP